MTGVGDDSHGRRPGRPWLVVGLLLAVGATVVLVMSDDLRYLRLGIVAALWAALIGAFLAVRARKNAAHSEEAVAEAQAVYELELEREIAARREFELELETETREAAQAQSREELDALRAEVAALRESLQSLFGGEVLLERVALTAQATRMRALNDEQRLVSAGPETKNGNGKKPAQLLSANKPVVEVAERPTELMDRVLDAVPMEPRRANGSGNGAANGGSNGAGNGSNGSISAGLNGFGTNGERPAPARGAQMPRVKPKRAEPVVEPESRPAAEFAGGADAGESGEFVVPDRTPPRGRGNLADAFGSRGGRAAESGDGRAKGAEAFAPRAEVVRESRGGAEAFADSRGGEGFSRPGAERGANGVAGRGPVRGARGGAAEPYGDTAYAAAGDTGAYNVQDAFDEDDERVGAEPVVRGRGGAPGASPAQPQPLPSVRAARGGAGEDVRAAKPAARRVPEEPVARRAEAAEPVARRGQNQVTEPVRRDADAQPTRTVAPVGKVEPAPAPVAKEEAVRAAPRLTARPGSAAEATKVSRPVEPAGGGRRRAEAESPAEPVTRAPSRLEQFSRSDLSPLAADTPTGRHGAPGSEGEVNSTLPESVRSTASSGSGGRRRRAEDSAAAGSAGTAPAGGGRRRRAEGEPAAWQGGTSGETAAHGRRSAETAESAAEPAEAGGGSHAAGRSVTELLAANGKGEGSPRRRRRAED